MEEKVSETLYNLMLFAPNGNWEAVTEEPLISLQDASEYSTVMYFTPLINLIRAMKFDTYISAI